jgi:hypothetical protein
MRIKLQRVVVYLHAAKNRAGLLPIRLCGVKPTVISPPSAFQTLVQRSRPARGHASPAPFPDHLLTNPMQRLGLWPRRYPTAHHFTQGPDVLRQPCGHRWGTRPRLFGCTCAVGRYRR